MTSSRRRLAVLPLVLALLLVAGAPSSAQQAPVGAGSLGAGFTFGVRPYADPGAKPRSAFVLDLGAGHSATDRVMVVNPSSEPKDLYVYTADAYTTEVGGGFGLRLRKDAKRDAGSWITLPVDRYTVAPRTSALLPIQIDVPPDATPGDHSAGIVAEEILPEAASDKGAGVVPVHRVAARVYVRVQGPVHAAVTIDDLKVSHQSPIVPNFTGAGSATIEFSLRNTGNVRAQLQHVNLTLEGPFGRELHEVRLTRATERHLASTLPDQVLPGSAVRFSQRFTGLPIGGPVSAVVAVEAVDPVRGKHITTKRSSSFWLIPWLWVLLVTAVAFLWWLRRGRNRPTTPGINPVVPEPGAPELVGASGR